MKKIILLLIVLSLLCLPGCKSKQEEEVKEPTVDPIPEVKVSAVDEMCAIAKGSKPTKTITTVKFVTYVGDELSGNYSTVTDGTDAIFDYTYQKMNTPAESLATGNFDPIVTYSGTIYYKDGAYSSSNGDEWIPGTGTAYDLKLNFDNNLFKSAKNSEDGLSLEIQMNAEALKAFLGTDLNVSGLATVTVSHNGTNLTFVTITCSTENGTLTIRNSYTYNRQDNLFPEVEEE